MPKTYNDIYFSVRNALRENGVEAYSLEARILLAAAAGKTTEQLMRDMYLYASSEIEERARAACVYLRFVGVLRASHDRYSGCSYSTHGHGDPC